MQPAPHSTTSSGEEELQSDPEVPTGLQGFTITSTETSVLREPQNSTFNKKEAMQVSMWMVFDNSDTNNKLQKVRTWFYNHYDCPHRQLIRFTRRWSAQNTFYHENKDEIGELTEQISGSVPGSCAYLAALQDATTQLWKKLASDEQVTYANLANQWSDERPPKHIQAKDEYNNVLDNGVAFTHFCPDWKNANIWLQWMKYALMCYSKVLYLMSDIDPEPSLFGMKTHKRQIEIKTDANGKPEIPAVTPATNITPRASRPCSANMLPLISMRSEPHHMHTL
ncbi:hypothetical protein V8E53_003991 [Lactarius tabidus]